MTKLERRDRRRAIAVFEAAKAAWMKADNPGNFSHQNLQPFIAAALKREREEAGFAAVNYLFARKADRAKATAAILGTEKGKK